jgi:hypothetical protein
VQYFTNPARAKLASLVILHSFDGHAQGLLGDDLMGRLERVLRDPGRPRFRPKAPRLAP